MEKLTEFKKIELVDWNNPDAYMPKIKEHGVLYISHRFNLAIHLCACGCGIETVTPLAHDEWQLTTKKIDGTTEKDRPYDFTATLRPSIWNQKLQCKSHYNITDNKIKWL